MTISGQKQLSPCPIGERAATVERIGAHEFFEEATTVSTEFFAEKGTVDLLKGR